MSTTAVSSEPGLPSPNLRLRTTLAGVVGNVMEWYDFAVYGYFAPLIGRIFFPSDDPTASLLAAFGVFAAGFLMRPLGGVVFGHIGDRFGRKAALTLSVLAMAIPTFLIGVLPGYAQVGVLASVLLVLLRIIQGLSVGGEYTTSVVFLVEAAPPGRRGLAGSWSTVGATVGTLLGSALGALLSLVLSDEQVNTWGWRLPFLLGLVVGMAGLYVRKHIPEPPAAPKEAQASRSPLWEALQQHWRTILQIAGMNVVSAVGFYTAFVYLVTFMEKCSDLSESAALDINSLNMLVLLVAIAGGAALSDRIGRKPVLAVASFGLLVLAWPLLWLVAHHEVALVFLGQLGFAVLVGAYCGVMPATMVEVIPARVRCCAVSIGYNLSLGVIGGLTPLMATWLIARTHDNLAPAYAVMGAAAVSLGFVLCLGRPAAANGES